MRRLVALAVIAGAIGGACASIGALPGGPERTTPPELLKVTPESGAVNVKAKSVVFTFDDIISDRAVLEDLFLLSPQDGAPKIKWHREEIEIQPRHGFRPNTAYSITLRPGLSDLRGNVLKTGRALVFSTGATIPPYSVFGRVFDWLAERPATRAYVEVIRRPDSLLYVGTVDSVGQFGIGPLAQGTYTVRALIDNNNNRTVDPGEPWDSVHIVVGGGTSPFVELLAVQRDTIPPRLLTLSVPDTFSLVAIFDKPVNPATHPGPSSFRVVGADSVPLTIKRVLTHAEVEAEMAVRDSITRDSAARADTARRLPTDTGRRAVPPVRDTTRGRGGPVQAPPPKPSRPAPPREFTLRLDSLTPFRTGKSYRVSAISIQGLLGRPGNSERILAVPRPAPPDTTKAPARQARPGPPTRPSPPVRRPP